MFCFENGNIFLATVKFKVNVMWTTEIHLKHLLTPQTPIIKNIVLEIIRECGNVSVERKFVTLLVHMLALQFKDIDTNENFDRDAIEKLISMCMKLIIGKQDCNY